jgi:hypothetical protein
MAEFSYERALARMMRLAAGLGAAGVAVILVARGPRDAGGFLIGAILSLASFRSWRRLAEMLGDSGKPPARGSAAFLAMRYLLIAGAVYAIVKLLGITPAAVVVGLLVSVAAVVLELLYELVTSR